MRKPIQKIKKVLFCFRGFNINEPSTQSQDQPLQFNHLHFGFYRPSLQHRFFKNLLTVCDEHGYLIHHRQKG